MTAAQTPESRDLFRSALHGAVTQGLSPDPDTQLGHYTLVAIRVIAAEHPDASADLINSAYDAFLSEHS
jgi:hypothetical protein